MVLVDRRLADPDQAAVNRLQAFLIDTIRAELDKGVMTQRQLAHRIGYTEKHVSQLLRGAASSVEGYGRMLEALGIELPNV